MTRSMLRVALCSILVMAVAGSKGAAEDQQLPVLTGREKTLAAPALSDVKFEMGSFAGPMEHMMVFRNGSSMLMSGGPTYRSIIKATNTGLQPVSWILDIDEATKKTLLGLAKDAKGQYWQFEPASVDLSPGEMKEVILYIGLNTGRWNNLSGDEQARFKDVCGKARITRLSANGK